MSNTNGSEDNQLIDMQESFQFLSSINFPSDLTIAQHTLHKFLEEKYVQVIETINKQSKELLTIQKQIRIQGELRDMLERLEKEKSADALKHPWIVVCCFIYSFYSVNSVMSQCHFHEIKCK